MKYATFAKSAFAVTAILVAAACANSADVPAEDVAPTDPPPAAAAPLPSKPAATPTPEKKCAPACKTDSDCQNSCPAVPGGVQCCDTKSGACFGSKTSACPVETTPDAGEPPPAY